MLESLLSASSSAAASTRIVRGNGDEAKALEGELSIGAALSADVPDLGFLGSLRADDGGQNDLVGRDVVSAFKASWGAYQRGLKGGV